MRFIFFLLIIFTSTISNAQHLIDEECGAVAGPEELAFMKSFGTMASSALDEDTIVYIPVNYFLCRRSDGSGGLNPNVVPSLTDELNEYYIHAGVQFYQCNDINFIDSTEYYDFVSNQEQEVCGPRDRFGVMNVYFFNTVKSASGGGLCGYAYFPGSRRDRIVMSNACALNGSTFVHEVGHFFSLFHTHGKTNSGTTDELVDGSNCANTGDDVCDTPADPNLNGKVNRDCEYTGTAKDANGDDFMPDPHNIMSYSRKDCRDFMSPGQYARVAFSARFHRPYFEPCCSDTFRMVTNITPIRCAGEHNGRIEVVEANGFGRMIYSWSVPGDSTVIDSLGAGIYYAIVTDRLGCRITDTIYLQDPNIPGGQITVVPEHCSASNGSITVDSLIGQGGVRWLITSGLDTLSSADSLDAGFYAIHFMDSVGCTAIDTVGVGFVDMPSSGLERLSIRYCETDTVSFPVVELGDQHWIASWVDSSAQLIPTDSLAGTIMAPGEYILQIEDTLWHCLVFDTILVADSLIDLKPSVQYQVSNFRLILSDLTEQPVSNRRWSIVGLVDSSEQLTFISPDSGWVQYCLELENRCGEAIICDSVQIAGFQVQLNGYDALCPDGAGKIDLLITGDTVQYTTNWYSSTGTSGTSLDSLPPGHYTIEVIDEHGSIWTDSMVLSAPDPIVLADVAITASSGMNGSVEIKVSGGTDPYTFEWSNGNDTPVIKDLLPGEYYCTVTDANNCIMVFGPFEVPLISNTSQWSELFEIAASPSPFQGEFDIVVSSTEIISSGQISVHDILGKKIYGIDDLTGTMIRVNISAWDWPAGPYFVQFRSGGQMSTIQVIKN